MLWADVENQVRIDFICADWAHLKEQKEQKISYWKMVQICDILQQKRHFCCLDLYNRGSKNKAQIIFATFNYLWNMEI